MKTQNVKLYNIIQDCFVFINFIEIAPDIINVLLKRQFIILTKKNKSIQ